MSGDGVSYGALVVEAPLASEAASFDAHAIEEIGVPQPVLMETAGRQAAQLVQRIFPEGPVVGLVGGGNNGGDALVALRTLQSWGRPVRAVLTSERGRDDPRLHGWDVPMSGPSLSGPNLAPGDQSESLARDLVGTVVLDGMLGTGLRGAPRADVAACIRAINRAETRAVVALDAPSGANGNDGTVPGEAVRADLTICFGWPKLGILLHPARALAGRILAVEIGFPPVSEPEWARVITPLWARRALPRRHADTHKNQVGSLCLLAGWTMAGAGVLAVRAAFRAGCGLVRVVGHHSLRSALLEACPEAIWIDGGESSQVEAAVEASAVLAAGPGLGTGAEARAVFQRFLEARSRQPLVVDADALTLLSEGERPQLEGPVLVTPHPGEMSRLMGTSVASVQSDRPAAARDLARSSGWTVLLKGAPSLVSGPEGPLMVSMLGTSDLAVAGMGDVLTGTAASLAAQGLDVGDAAALALHVTGQAARRSGLGASLTPSDVVDGLAAAISDPESGHPMEPFVTFDQPAAR